MNTPAHYTDALNAWIRCGNREADPLQADAHRAWRREQDTLWKAAAAIAQDLRSQARELTDAERGDRLRVLERELERIGIDCPLAQF